MIKRRAAVAALIALSLSAASFAQETSGRPLTLVVPFAPGGNADIVARSISVPMSKLLGASVVVENRGGGGGGIGTAVVAKAAPDGHTLLAATPSQLGTLPHLFKSGYQASDLVPIGVLSKTSIALIVKADDPRFKTVEELIAYAKANPGQLNVGHAGPGSPNHLAMLQFEDAADTRFTPIGYRGSGPALIDLLAGQVDIVFDQVTSSLPHLKGGKLSALVVLAPMRDVHLPQVRKLSEAGLQEFDASTYIGILAPKGVSDAVVSSLTATIKEVASDPAFDRGLREIGSGAFYADPARFAQIIQADDGLARSMIQAGRLVHD